MFEPIVNSIFISNILVHISLLVVTILCFLLYLTSKDSRVCKHFKNFNGPQALPIVGNALSLLVPHEQLLSDVLKNWVNKYGSCFTAWVGNVPYVMIANALDVEKLLSSTIHINKGEDYKQFLNVWLRTGLLTAPREKWFHRRKLLTPAFHFKILEDFVPIFNEQAKILNIMLEKQIKQTSTFDICPYISRCTLDVICETAMGVQINAQIGCEAEYVNTVCGMSNMLLIKGINPVYRNSFIWRMTNYSKLETKYLQDLHDFTDKMIKERKKDRLRKSLCESPEDALKPADSQCAETGVKRRKAFLDLLLDVQEGDSTVKFTDLDIREEVDTFMFEGHDTTGANLEWTLLLLANHPQYQKLVHEELDSVFKDDVDKTRDITTADLKQLKYLECCVKESLRLYPSVPFFIRKADQDIPLDEQRIIPKGASVLIIVYSLHRDPKIFPDPEKFDPERFSAENATGRHPYAYVPFSADVEWYTAKQVTVTNTLYSIRRLELLSPISHRPEFSNLSFPRARNCIGQKFAITEEKIILATLLRKFRLEAVDTVDSAIPLPDIILRPKDGIRVKLIKRN